MFHVSSQRRAVVLIGCHKVQQGVRHESISGSLTGGEESEGGTFPPERGGQSIELPDKKTKQKKTAGKSMMVFSFFLFLHTRKLLFFAKNVTIKVMGVICCSVPVLFCQFHRHNKSQTSPPTFSPCPAVLIGRRSCPSSCSWPRGQPGGLLMVLTV